MVTWQCVFAKCSLRSLLHLRFGVLSLPKGLALCSASGNLHFAWACFPIHPILFFYLIAFRVRVVQSDIVWECVLEPIIHFVNY